jgi:hypothetical protein
MGFQPMRDDFHLRVASITQVTNLEAQRALHLIFDF